MSAEPASGSRAVFLSYASQDAAAAKRIAEALRTGGVEVWLDQEGGLVGGDAWDRKIREQIAECALFVPVISASTQARLEGYFRLEWKLAAQRTHLMAAARTFLLPVVIDDTRDADAHVPEEFKSVQWTRIPCGETSAALCARVQGLLDGSAAQSVGGASRPDSVRQPELSGRKAPPTPSRRARWLAPFLVGLAAAIALAVWRPWKSSPPAAAAKPVTERKAEPVAPLGTDKSIAVLPFTNLSDDKENTAFFSDGMHEDILTTLANIPELRVTSRTSVMEYRDTTKKIPQIARELNVAYILEGSVRRAGNQIRITGQLIRAAKDEHLWARSYDRELTPKDMFTIQAALATEIAGALQAAISPATKKLVERRPTENLAAYDLYLQARSLRPWVKSELENRERLLQQAVGLDPEFAAAWGTLAADHTMFLQFSFDRTPERRAKADAAIARAVRLAPDAPEVIHALGSYASHGYRDFARAAAEFEKFIQLQPNNPDAYFSLGLVQVRQGRWRDALGSFRRRAELETDRDDTWVIRVLRAGRRWDEAIDAQRRRVDGLGERQRPVGLAQLIFAATGSTKEMAEVVASTDRDSLRFVRAQKGLAAMKGDFAEWNRLHAVDEMADSGGRNLFQRLNAVMMLAAGGKVAEALARLERDSQLVGSALEGLADEALMLRLQTWVKALRGDNEGARRDARKALELEPASKDTETGPLLQLNLAQILAWTGDKDGAIAELARVLSVPFTANVTLSVHTLRVDPAFAKLRGDPRFEALLKDPKNNAPLF